MPIEILRNQLQSKQLHLCYILMSDELLLLNEARALILETAKKMGFTDKILFTVESGFNWNEVKKQTQNVSLFAEKKCLDIRMQNGTLNKEGLAFFLHYVETLKKQPDENTLLILSVPKLESKTQKTEWFSQLKAVSSYFVFAAPTHQGLPQWIEKRLKYQGQTMDPAGLEFLADQVEGNLMAAHQEILKLGIIAPQGHITLEMLEQVTINVARYNVFELSHAWLSGDYARTLQMLDGLLAEGAELLSLNAIFARDLRQILIIQQLRRQQQSLSRIFQELKIWDKTRKNLLENMIKKSNSTQIEQALRICLNIDKAIKGVLPFFDPMQALYQMVRQLTLKKA